ncbi:CLUMA_CG001937, isoform A [Clunio marinus]|uniref:CLUMA_CG001937, isoform A n=1 Tax=Clunio marinus TaxID=568069 RepID=A0A1J1HJC7_9DIPT|nr:CLUMA_CG001937, isoform A [Clunio marinus]
MKKCRPPPIVAIRKEWPEAAIHVRDGTKHNMPHERYNKKHQDPQEWRITKVTTEVKTKNT